MFSRTRIHETVHAPDNEINEYAAYQEADQKRINCLRAQILMLIRLFRVFVFCLFVSHALVPRLRLRTDRARTEAATNSDCGKSKPARCRQWQSEPLCPPLSKRMSLKNSVRLSRKDPGSASR